MCCGENFVWKIKVLGKLREFVYYGLKIILNRKSSLKTEIHEKKF